MKALLLCGGKAERQKCPDSTEHCPSSIIKHLIVIKNLTLLEWNINLFKNNGAKEIIMCTSNETNDKIEELIGDGSKFGIKVNYSIEKEKLDTAGAIKNATKFIENEKNFFVGFADQITTINLDKMLEFHIKNDAKVTMSLIRPNCQYGHVVLNNKNIVTNFREKPLCNNFINGGYYVLKNEILDIIPKKGNFEIDVLPGLSKQKKVYGYLFSNSLWFGIDSKKHKKVAEDALSKIQQ